MTFFNEQNKKIPSSVYRMDEGDKVNKENGKKEGTDIYYLFSLMAFCFDDIKEHLQGLIELRDVNNQIGQQLDEIGKILKESRHNRPDDEYRKFLYIAVQKNISNGSLKSVSQIIRLISGNSTFTLTEPILPRDKDQFEFDGQGTLDGESLMNPICMKPSTFEVEFNAETTDAEIDLYRTVVDEVKGAGVRADLYRKVAQ